MIDFLHTFSASLINSYALKLNERDRNGAFINKKGDVYHSNLHITTVVVLNVGISRYFIQICPISISQKMSLCRYNENLYIMSLHRINFIIQIFCSRISVGITRCRYIAVSLYRDSLVLVMSTSTAETICCMSNIFLDARVQVVVCWFLLRVW